MERQKQMFKNHIATLTTYENITILDFKKPDSNEYRIRFLFEEDYYRLHITGDLGELIATNYTNMRFEHFDDFVNNIPYFIKKIDCHDRPIYYYDEDMARNELLNIIEDSERASEIIEFGKYFDVDEFVDDVLINFDYEMGVSMKGYDTASEYIDDFGEIAETLGRTRTIILDIYMLAFKLATEQLESRG